MQMAMVLTGQKPKQGARADAGRFVWVYPYGECSEGLPGSTKSVGCVERNARNLGDPGSSWTLKESRASTQEIRILSHRRGNPETEVGRTLNEDERTQTEGGPGRQTRPKRRREADDCQGVRSAHSTLRR